VPITLVCEEAHRYVPNNPDLGFEPTRRAIARIAKEGRKYGVSLCVVSQRPSELDSTILSQCNTVFSMRMSNDLDQDFVRSAIFDTAASLLDFLPSMGPREAIVFGDGVTLPGRIRFDDLPEHALPRSRTACFTEMWQLEEGKPLDLDDVVERWRAADSPKLNTGVLAHESGPAVDETMPGMDGAPATHPQPGQQPMPHPGQHPAQQSLRQQPGAQAAAPAPAPLPAPAPAQHPQEVPGQVRIPRS
jgi:hypothetical protein